MLNMNEDDLKRIKAILFIGGGVFAAIVGIIFSSRGFNFEVKDMAWVGYGLGVLCFIVQIAFSSQLAYSSYNYVIFAGGILAYVYSGWSNYVGIMSISPSANPWFALMLGEFIDLVAEPLIVFGMIGVTANGDGDFFRNLLGVKSGRKSNSSMFASSQGGGKGSPPQTKFTPSHKPGLSFSSKPDSTGFYGREGAIDKDFDDHVDEFRNIMRDK